MLKINNENSTDFMFESLYLGNTDELASEIGCTVCLHIGLSVFEIQKDISSIHNRPAA